MQFYIALFAVVVQYFNCIQYFPTMFHSGSAIPHSQLRLLCCHY